MSPDEVAGIREELRELRDAMRALEALQRENGKRSGKIESRVFELELWRARFQGVAATSRVAWLLAGGAITGIIVTMFNNA